MGQNKDKVTHLRKLYELELLDKTEKNGRILAYITIPIILLFILQDFYFLKIPALFFSRLIFIIPFFLYISYIFFVKNKKVPTFKVIHTIFLSSILLMVSGMTIIVVIDKGISWNYVQNIINTMVVTVFLVFLLAGVLIDKLHYILAVPLLIDVAILIIYSDVHLKEVLFLTSNVTTATVILIIRSFQRKKCHYDEFVSRKNNEDLIEELKMQVSRNEDLIKKINTIAMYDELTGVYSRFAGYDRLNSIIAKAHRKVTTVLVFIDIDTLKFVNDKFGHKEGDNYITTITDVLKTRLRQYDSIIRYGGDEFLIVLEDSDKNDANRRLIEIRSELAEIKRDYKLDISYGLTEISEKNIKTLDQVITSADKLMYEMKKNKKKENERND